MIFNLWKTVTAGKQTLTMAQTEMAGTTMTNMPIKSRCHIKWWNQASGKGAKWLINRNYSAYWRTYRKWIK